ncbi:MAG TPA: hypothetical protein VGP76_20285 [Planctomycetaceae bacterium]|nr:hypothetical protein [Planctomycetaceae bacterium]
MADENGNNQDVDDERELERALSLLRPAASQIDRDRFLFLAGRASAESVRPGSVLGRWMWPSTTVLSSVAAVVLAALLVTRTDSAARRTDSVDTDRTRVSAGREATVTTGQIAQAQSSPGQTSEPGQVGPEMRGLTTDSIVAAPTADEVARAMAAGSNSPRLRSFVLAYGIDALPEPAPIRRSVSDARADDEPSTERAMLRQALKGRSAG